MPRGGPRPGAGAPAGNMNALTHGRSSARLQAVVAALAAHPTTREALVRLARRQRAMKKDAERTAALLLTQLLERCLLGLRDNQTPGQAAGTDALLNAILSAHNQTPDTPQRNQSNG